MTLVLLATKVPAVAARKRQSARTLFVVVLATATRRDGIWRKYYHFFFFRARVGISGLM